MGGGGEGGMGRGGRDGEGREGQRVREGGEVGAFGLIESFSLMGCETAPIISRINMETIYDVLSYVSSRTPTS